MPKAAELLPEAHIVVDSRGVVTLRQCLTFAMLGQMRISPENLRELAREIEKKFGGQ